MQILGEPAETAAPRLPIPAAGDPEWALSPELGAPLLNAGGDPESPLSSDSGVPLPAAGEPDCSEGEYVEVRA